MKILIDDGMQIKIGTGIGKYTTYLYEGLKKNLSNKDKVSLSAYDPEDGSRKIAKRIKYLLYINSRKFRDKCKRMDIVHFTDFVIPVLRRKGVKYVVTIHDLAVFTCPQTLPFLYRAYGRINIKYAMKHADMVLTDSYSIKREMEEKLGCYSAKIKMVYPGLYDEYALNDNTDASRALNKYNLRKHKYFIFVGTVEKRKNPGILIEAFTELKKDHKNDYKLVLVGRPGKGYEKYASMIEKSAAAKDIVCTGYISTDECKSLYKNSAAYVFPTIYEGFGSTQLECMANHLPLICSDIPTNREISNGYGLFFDLDDADSLVEQMRKIVRGEYDHKRKNEIADETIKNFSWDTLTGEFIQCYKECRED